MTALIEYRDVRVDGDDGPIVAGFSAAVPAGCLTVIVGPSGAGKTTLLKTVSGLMAPTSGRVELAGEAVDGPPERMALVFQDYSRSLYPWMKVSDNVAFPCAASS
jgi:NitT/TauT family transport system ATP-binding protein